MASEESEVSVNSEDKNIQKESNEDKVLRLEIEDKKRKESRSKSRKEALRNRDRREIKTTPRGCFSFQVQSIKLNIEDGKSLSRVGLAFSILCEKGTLPEWWDTPKPVAGSVGDGGVVTFERVCIGTTKLFTLTEEILTKLLTVQLSISLYEMKGNVLNEASDVLLGSGKFDLNSMLVEDRPELQTTISIIRPENGKGLLRDDESSATLLLSCDDELAEYVLGSCVFDFGPLKVVNPPASWTLETIEVESEDGTKSTKQRSPMAIKELMDGNKLGQKFAISLGPNSLIPTLSFSQGIVSYVPPEPLSPEQKLASRKSTTIQAENIEEENEPLPKTKGDWDIVFNSASKVFLTRQNLKKVHRSILDGESIELLLTRSKEKQGGTKEGEVSEAMKVEDDNWSIQLTANISQLLVPDAKNCVAVCSITQIDESVVRSAEIKTALMGNGDETTKLTCSFPISLSRPFQESTIEVECQQLSADDVVPPRRQHAKKPPRKFEDELRGELSEMVRSVCDEYDVLFSSVRLRPQLTVKDRGAQLLEVLATAGVRHDFMERLKPVVQRAVASRFGRAPCNQEEKDKYLTELYSWLMSCVSQILGSYYAPVVEKEQEEIARQRREKSKANQASLNEGGGLDNASSQVEEHSQEVAEVLEQLEDLRVVSIDQEAMGEWSSAMTKNEDRVTEAVNWLVANPEHSWVVSNVWYSFGQFCLRAAVYEGPLSPKFSDLRGKAVEALTEAYALNTSNAEVLKMLGAILLEQGRYEKAAEVLYDALDLETPSIGKRRRSISEEPSERSLAQAAEPEPLTSILMCLYFTTIGNYVSAGEFLGHAVRAYKHRGMEAPGKPRRTGSLLALQAAEFLVNAALPGLATRALELAAKCEAASIAKAAGMIKTKPTPGNAAARIAAAKLAQIEATEKVMAEGGEGAEPACIVQQRLRVSVKIALLNRDHVSALPLARQSTEHDEKDAESWSLLGDSLYGTGAGQWEEAAKAYNKAISLISKSSPPKPPPLRLLVRLGALYLNLNRFEEAEKTYMLGAGSWQTCSMWLGVGISLLRQEKFGEAESALQEANIRNNRSGGVWGYMCLLCLNSGSTRLTQADHAREVAERLSLDDAVLLRELGNAYTSLDRLETAEGLYRRSLAVDEGNSHTRRRLADVLSAQNAVADAVNEYLRVIDLFKEKYLYSNSSSIESEKVKEEDKKECLFAIDQCKQLLKTLGRADEFGSLRLLRAQLS